MRLSEIIQESSDIQPIDRNNFKSIPSYLVRYFDNEKYFNENKNIKVHIIDMQVSTYIRLARNALTKSYGTYTPTRLSSGSGRVEEYAERMKMGDKFPLPYINLIDNTQDGLHRAEAAQLLGIEKISVFVIDDYKKP